MRKEQRKGKRWGGERQDRERKRECVREGGGQRQRHTCTVVRDREGQEGDRRTNHDINNEILHVPLYVQSE